MTSQELQQKEIADLRERLESQKELTKQQTGVIEGQKQIIDKQSSEIDKQSDAIKELKSAYAKIAADYKTLERRIKALGFDAQALTNTSDMWTERAISMIALSLPDALKRIEYNQDLHDAMRFPGQFDSTPGKDNFSYTVMTIKAIYPKYDSTNMKKETA